LWGQVAGKITQRYKAMLPGVRQEYDNALKTFDKKLLETHGGGAWDKVVKAVSQAKKAESERQYGKAVSLYRQARGLLGEADRIARTAASAAQTDAAIAQVNALIAKRQYHKARAALAAAAKAAPNDPRLAALRKTIDTALNVTLRIKGKKFDMVLTYVEPGRFKMGSPENEPGRGHGEKLHEVEITKPFYIGRFEVTREQFECFVNSAAYKTTAEKTGWATALAKTRKLQRIRGASWRNPGFSQKGDHPVVCVSWDDATAFCTWMSDRFGGLTVTLPTEAEWEFACRMGTQTRFAFGNSTDDLHRHGNYADGSTSFAWGDSKFSDGHPTTSPVGFFSKNNKKARISDMHGNAAEWCLDHYGPYNVGTGGKAVTDPTGIARGALRVIRGGSWVAPPAKCRSASRARLAPVAPTVAVGFRVVATGRPPTQPVAVAQAAKANAKPLTGKVGVGTWETVAEFKEFVVTRGGQKLFVGNDSKQGDWAASPGSKWKLITERGLGSPLKTLRSEKLAPRQFIIAGDPKWTNYTIQVKARKLRGKEGFLVRFADRNNRFFYWNVGGKGNTTHIIGRRVGRRKAKWLNEVKAQQPIHLNTWYHLRVELKGAVVNCYLNNKLIQTLDTGKLGK